MNLKEETLEMLKELEKTEGDILFVGSRNGKYECSWDSYLEMADIEYDDSYGAAEVAGDLIIVFKDNTIMSRGEYDGSEWWEYQPVFKKAKSPKKINRILGGMWKSIGDLNGVTNEQS